MIEEALCRDLGIGDLAAIWAKVSPADEDEGMELARTELHEARRERRDAGGP